MMFIGDCSNTITHDDWHVSVHSRAACLFIECFSYI